MLPADHIQEQVGNDKESTRDNENDISSLKIVSVCSIAPEDFQHDSPGNNSGSQNDKGDSEQPMDLTAPSSDSETSRLKYTSSVSSVSGQSQIDTQSVLSETESVSSRASSPSAENPDSISYKVFRCHLCSDSFYQFESFISHLAVTHKDPNISFKCAECPCNIFENYESFEHHSRTVHSFAKPDLTRHALVPARYKVNQEKRQEASKKKEQKKRRLEFITSKLSKNTSSIVSSSVIPPTVVTTVKSTQNLPKAAYTISHHSYESSSAGESETNITTAQSPFPPRHMFGEHRRFPAPAHTVRSSNLMPMGKPIYQGQAVQSASAGHFIKPLSQPSVAMVHPTVQTRTWQASTPSGHSSLGSQNTSQGEDIEPGEIGRHGQRYQMIRSQLAGPPMAEVKSSESRPVVRVEHQPKETTQPKGMLTKLRQVGQVPPLRRAPDPRMRQDLKSQVSPGTNIVGQQRKEVSFPRPPQMQQFVRKGTLQIPQYPPPPYPHQRPHSAPPARPASGQSRQYAPQGSREHSAQGMTRIPPRLVQGARTRVRNPPPNVAPFGVGGALQTPYKCPHCHIQTYSPKYLEDHIMNAHVEHIQQDLFECPYCPGSAVMPKNMAVHHVKQEHPNYPPRLKLYRPQKSASKQTV